MKYNSLFLQKVADFIVSKQLLSSDKLHLVGFSGGADSTALLMSLKMIGYSVEAIHCNFNLRGSESMRDELFCENFCKQHEIPLHKLHFDTKEYASLHHISIEMAARDLRYNYFEQLRQALDAETICVAHHQDDSVETLLLNLCTGTGLHGLTGIKAKNRAVVRPFLSVTRNEILSFLNDIGQDYIVDSSNLIDDVKRNKIRLNLITELSQINEAAVSNISKCIRRLSEAEKIYDYAIQSFLTHASLPKSNQYMLGHFDLTVFESSPSPVTLLYEALRPLGLTESSVHEVLRSINANNKIWKGYNCEVLIYRKRLIIMDSRAFDPVSVSVPEPGLYLTDSLRLEVKGEVYAHQAIPADPYSCLIDAETVQFPLTLRNLKSGDRFIPFGMKGSKLINDLLREKGYHLFDKRCQLVVEQKDGSIIWLVGHRIGQKVRITPATRHVLLLTVQR